MSPRPPLSARLRVATAALHREVEATPLIADLLGGRLPRTRYRALLSSLLPIYEALEIRLADAGGLPAALRDPALRRSPALAADLARLADPTGNAAAVAAEAHDYHDHLMQVDEPRLVAHAYLRYLGDLAGGQRLAKRVGLAYGDDATAFYRFAAPGPAVLAARLRSAIDALALDEDGEQALVDEACDGFRRHGRLFAELYAPGG